MWLFSLQDPQRPKEGIVSLGTVVRDGCELFCEGEELSPGPLQEQSVLLVTESSLKKKKKKCVLEDPLSEMLGSKSLSNSGLLLGCFFCRFTYHE